MTLCDYRVEQDGDELVIECPCAFGTEEEAQAHGMAIARAYAAQLEQEVV